MANDIRVAWWRRTRKSGALPRSLYPRARFLHPKTDAQVMGRVCRRVCVSCPLCGMRRASYANKTSLVHVLCNVSTLYAAAKSWIKSDPADNRWYTRVYWWRHTSTHRAASLMGTTLSRRRGAPWIWISHLRCVLAAASVCDVRFAEWIQWRTLVIQNGPIF